jgi:hypothetical protein
VHAQLHEEAWSVNRKRVRRLRREERSAGPRAGAKRRRVGDSTVPAQRLRAERPNHVVVIGNWREDYKQPRPHFALGTRCHSRLRRSMGRHDRCEAA